MLQYFQVGTDENGKVQFMEGIIYENAGSHFNEHVYPFTKIYLTNCYDSSNWNVEVLDVRTDLATNVYCRAPGKFMKCRHKGKGFILILICLFSFVTFVAFDL